MELEPVCNLHFYNCENEHYKSHLKASVDSVSPLLTNKQLKNLIDNKLQFKRRNFDINQYIQAACELSVISRVYVNFSKGFEYEPKRNIGDAQHKNKDVDFSFEYEFLRFNVEVKCFNRKLLKEENLNSEEEALSVKSRFLSLKDFFIKANEKFGFQGDFEANIIFVCCYDLDDFIDVSNSLAGESGVCFRKNNPDGDNECVLDAANFDKIDAIIVSNLAFHHENFNRSTEGKYLNPWDFYNTFVMGFQLHNKQQKVFKQIIDQMVKLAFNIQNDRYSIFCEKEGLDKFNFDVSLRKLIEHLNYDLEGYYFVSEK